MPPDLYLHSPCGSRGTAAAAATAATAEARILRHRQAGLLAAMDRAVGNPPQAVDRRLVKVYDGGAMPTLPDHVYFTHPVDLDGDECEGCEATPAVYSDVTLPVVVLWSKPDVGDLLVATMVGGRWVAERSRRRADRCILVICVTACSTDSPLVGATVTIRDPNTNEVIDTCVTVTDPESGCCTLSIPIPDDEEAGTEYHVTVEAAGYVTYDRIIALHCNDEITVKLKTTAPVTFNVKGCCGLNLNGASVTLDGITKTTNSSGDARFGLTDSGTYPWSVSMSKYATQSGTVTLTECGNATQNKFLVPASGYQCGPNFNCDLSTRGYIPIPETLTLTDSVYGTTTLTYDGGTGTWIGTKSFSTPGYCGCAAGNSTLYYSFFVACSGTPSRGLLTVEIDAVNFGYCPRNTSSWKIGILGGTGGANSPGVQGCSPAGPLDWSADWDLGHDCTTGNAFTRFTYPGGVTFTVTE